MTGVAAPIIADTDTSASSSSADTEAPESLDNRVSFGTQTVFTVDCQVQTEESFLRNPERYTHTRAF